MLLFLFFIVATDLVPIENPSKIATSEYLKSKSLLLTDPELAIKELQHNYDTFQHSKSLETIIDHYLFKLHDYSKALEYSKVLSEDGHSYGHFIQGVFLSANLTSSSNSVQESLIHFAMASRDRHLPSLMAMGYRYSFGIGVKESCSKSLQYYKAAAKIIVRHTVNGPPLGTLLPPHPIHLESTEGGIYGHISHSKPNDRLFGDESSGISEEDIIDYSKMLAESGDISSQYLLGQVFYSGLQNFKQNFQLAHYYFSKATQQLSKIENEEEDNDEYSTRKKDLMYIGKSASMLGRMYLRGEYVPKNNELAFHWFTKGVDCSDGSAYSGLAYMYEFGLNTKLNMKKALDFYTKAAERQDAYGLTRLGKYYKENKDYIASSNYLNIASHFGNVQASFLLGDMVQNGLGISADCKQAVKLYKRVAESGYEWFYPYTQHGYESLAHSDKENALINYIFASEMGLELAQVNLAFLIDTNEISTLPYFPSLESVALVNFHRAANQGNVDARLKAGDYHFNGIGVNVSFPQAFEYYKAASDSRSSYAAWNMGYMYENGIGTHQDFNLALRFYDLAYDYNKDTWLVVYLSVFKLKARWSYREFLNSFQESPEEIIETKAPVPIKEEMEWEIEDMRIPTWKRSTNDMFNNVESLLFGQNSGMDNLVFFGLVIVSAWLYYIRRRNQQQERIVVDQDRPNPRLNQLLEQMRQQQRDRLQQQQVGPVDTEIVDPIEPLEPFNSEIVEPTEPTDLVEPTDTVVDTAIESIDPVTDSTSIAVNSSELRQRRQLEEQE